MDMAATCLLPLGVFCQDEMSVLRYEEKPNELSGRTNVFHQIQGSLTAT